MKNNITHAEMKKRKVKPRTVAIQESNTTLDEIYTDYTDCPKCNYSYVLSDAKYCAGCGRKIKWIKPKPEKKTKGNFDQELHNEIMREARFMKPAAPPIRDDI